MRYRIHEIKLRPGQGHGAFGSEIRKRIGRTEADIEDIEIIKESVDARRKKDIKLVYTLDFTCSEKLDLDKAVRKDYDKTPKVHHIPEGRKRPVVTGFGPCGMFAALILAEAGMRPVVIERGQAVDERVRSVERFWKEGVLDTESNVQFGEGGAGTFSDGKLTTGIKNIRISKVFSEFVRAGADPVIMYRQKPHIGTDRLRGIVKNIRRRIQSMGGEIFFDTKLEELITEKTEGGRRITAVKVTHRNGESRTIETDDLILAIGHSARDTFSMLYGSGIHIEQKPFSIGVRIEHPQELINKAQYGDPALAEKLGPADYKLNCRCGNGRGVYTFCMCPGGSVIDASSETGHAVTNGMSSSGRNGKNANSGLLVDVRTEDFGSDHPLAGVEFQRKYEKLAFENGGGRLPKTDYRSFREDSRDIVRRSIPGFAADAIIEAMPMLGRKLRGFDSDAAVFTAVETRSSSPVRIVRNDEHQTGTSGIYPAGEGPGYAGGIVSAAVDGIKTAEKILRTEFVREDR